MTFIDFLTETPDIIKELSKYVPMPNMAILRLVHPKLCILLPSDKYECSINTLMAYAAFNSFDGILEMTYSWGFTPELSTKCAALLNKNLRLADQILLPCVEIPLESAVQKCNYLFMHSPCRSIGPHLNGYPIEATIVELSVLSRYLLDTRLDPKLLFSKNVFMEKFAKFTNKLSTTIVVYCIETLIGRQKPQQWLYGEHAFITMYALAQLHRIIGLLVSSEKAIEQYLHTEKEYNNILSSFYMLAFLGERDIIEKNEPNIKCRINSGDITVPSVFQNIQSPFEYMCQDIISYNILAGASLGGHIEMINDRLFMVGDGDFDTYNVVLENVACGENNEIFQYAKTLPATNFDNVAHILTILDREDRVKVLRRDDLIGDDTLKNIYNQVIGSYPHCKKYVQPLRRMGVTDMRLQLFNAAGFGDHRTVRELLDVGTIYLDQEEYESAQRRWSHLVLWSKQDIDHALQWSIRNDHFACVPILKEAGAGNDPDKVLEGVLNGGVVWNATNISNIYRTMQYLSNDNYSQFKLNKKIFIMTFQRNISLINFRSVMRAPFYLFGFCFLAPWIVIKGTAALSKWGFRTIRMQWYKLRMKFK